MKNLIALPIVVALIPSVSYAADTGTPEALITVIEKKLDEIKTGQVQNYRLGDGTPDPFVAAAIAKAQRNAAANGSAPTLLGAKRKKGSDLACRNLQLLAQFTSSRNWIQKI